MNGLFIMVTDQAQAAYNDLRRFYNDGDYNACYLRAFETYLSPLLREDFLVNDETYKDVSGQYPLPEEDDDNQYIPAKGFLLYLRTYEKIMRECHIVGGFEETVDDGISTDKVVNPLDEYSRRRN